MRGSTKNALAILTAALLAHACGDDESGSMGADDGGGWGGSSGGGGDGGGDNAGDDGGTGTGGGDDGGDDEGGAFVGEPDGGPGEPPPPEEEEPADFRVPKASGKFVYSASEKTNRVAVINTDNLVIDVVDSGHGPTVVAPIPGTASGAGKVAVLCEASEEATFITTNAAGANTVELREIAPGANNVVASPDGDYVITYFDVDGEGAGGAGSDQEITVLETGGDGAYRLTVGSHPREVQFTEDGKTAYVTTDDGVNVIDLTEVESIGLPDLVPVVDDPGLDPSTLEIQISVAKGQALARVEGELWLVVTDLGTGVQSKAFLSAYPTDLDIAADGSFAVLMAPRKEGSLIVEVGLPVGQGTFYEEHEVGEEYVGVASLAEDGDALILYTTVDPWAEEGEEGPLGDPRKRVTIARRGSGDWSDQITLYTEVPVRSVGIAPDSENAILLHDRDAGINPAAPWPYTLLDLTAAFPVKKLQTAQAQPGPVVFTPEGDRAGVLLREDAADVRRVDMVNLRNFIVKGLDLGSPPEGAGYVEATKKIFISQEHPSGRITFVDENGAMQTVTGYELNDSVKD